MYAVGQPRLSQQGEWIAATLACGHGAYLASLNAAVQMKLWRRRVTGIHVLEKALELNKTGSAGTRSELEDRFLALTSRSGLPEPLVNTRVQDIEVDFHWPDLNLVIEVDGPGHTRPRTEHEDHTRDRTLRAAGLAVRRVAEHELERLMAMRDAQADRARQAWSRRQAAIASYSRCAACT